MPGIGVRATAASLQTVRLLHMAALLPFLLTPKYTYTTQFACAGVAAPSLPKCMRTQAAARTPTCAPHSAAALSISPQIRELETSLDYAQKDADACREIVGKLESERDEARAALAAAGSSSRHVGSDAVRGGGMGVRRTSSSALSASGDGSGTPGAKWQVQNRVGGGSLYGLTGDAPAAPARPAASPSPASVPPVDLVYLKNVVLKFLEAVVAGRTAERDALLPAVAAVVGASPAEFAAMRRVLVNTAPASTQVLNTLMNIRL